MRKALFLLIALFSVQALASPDVQSWQTKNGAKVMFVQAKGLPMADIRVVFDAGSARDGKLPGVATFTNAVLTESAGDWNADALAERLESRGIQMGNGVARDMAWVNLRTLSDRKILDVAVDTLAAVLARPRFAEPDVERIRQQLLVGLKQAEQNPGTQVGKLFMEHLYGDHPYAHDPAGTLASVPSIRTAQLAAFHKHYYVARNAVVAIVGDLDRKAAAAIAERVTAGMTAGQHAPALPKPAALETAKVEKLAFPSSQTHVRIGQLGMARHDPDYFPLYVGNHVLGGSSLVSLLGEEVRNKRGLSYSVYSYFAAMRQTGPFLMAAQTKGSQADQAIQVMRETLARFVEQGPSKDELQAAKQNLTGGFPLQVDSNKEIVQYIAMMGFYDLPLDWLDTLVSKIDAVTAEQVRDAFHRRVHPDRLLVLSVGGNGQ